MACVPIRVGIRVVLRVPIRVPRGVPRNSRYGTVQRSPHCQWHSRIRRTASDSGRLVSAGSPASVAPSRHEWARKRAKLRRVLDIRILTGPPPGIGAPPAPPAPRPPRLASKPGGGGGPPPPPPPPPRRGWNPSCSARRPPPAALRRSAP